MFSLSNDSWKVLNGRSSSQIEQLLRGGEVTFQQLKDFLLAPVSSRPSSSLSRRSSNR